MTPDELQALVLAGDAAPLVDALAPLDEKARRKLASHAFELHQAAIEHERKTPLGRLLGKAGEAAWRNAKLAVLGCCDGSKAKRLRMDFDLQSEPDQQLLLALLLARRPAWAEGWLTQLIDKKWVSGHWWVVLRSLVRAGVISKPAPRLYINVMVRGVGWTGMRASTPHVPLSRRLLEEADLLQEEIWCLFETEHPAFANDSYGGRPDNYESWTVALCRLAAEGHIDRGRLIDCALNAMASGLKPAMISTFVNFAAALRISVDELATRQALLCQLLANQTGGAVAFALDGLNQLEKARLLDRDGFLDAVEPALLFPKKSQPRSALALLKIVARQDAARRSRCVLAATRALSNVSEDVQRLATELIAAYPSDSEPALREAVDAQLESVAPTVRDKLSALSTEVDQTATDLTSLEARISQLPAKVIERWHLRSLTAGSWPVIAADEADYQPVVPIASADELLEAIALAVERVAGADEVERLLDAVARFADRRPDSKVADTIFQRYLKPTSMYGFTSSMGVPPQLVSLVGTWFGVEVKTGENYHDTESWWGTRFQPYLKALHARRSWQPLSTPTHAGGWIDPRIWVSRLNAAGDSINDSDGIQSLLRLAPFGRAEARQRIGSKLPGPWRRLADYALGGDCSAGMLDVFRSSLWVAAGRARQPTGDLIELGSLLGVANIPDALHESRFRLEHKPSRHDYVRWTSQSTYMPLDHAFDGNVLGKLDDIPQCMFYPRKPVSRYSSQWMGPWVIELKSQVWPANPRGFLYWGINRMLQRFDASSSVYEPNHVYMEALRPHPRVFRDVEYLALAIGCMSAEQEVRRSASEVLIRAGVEGRLEARQLAARLEELYEKGWFSMGRLATTLGVAARDSPQTAQVVVEALFAFLERVDGLPKGSHEVLSVVHQQAHRLGIAVPQSVAAKLAGQTGQTVGTGQTGKVARTKTAQLARDLLALQPNAQRASAARLEALTRLLERAEAFVGAAGPAINTVK